MSTSVIRSFQWFWVLRKKYQEALQALMKMTTFWNESFIPSWKSFMENYANIKLFLGYQRRFDINRNQYVIVYIPEIMMIGWNKMGTTLIMLNRVWRMKHRQIFTPFVGLFVAALGGQQKSSGSWLWALFKKRREQGSTNSFSARLLKDFLLASKEIAVDDPSNANTTANYVFILLIVL